MTNPERKKLDDQSQFSHVTISNVKETHRVSGVTSYGALGHVPHSTSKSESQLSKYCVVCEIS